MWALLLRHANSVVVARRLSCPAACGILVPRPGIEPVSPALEGSFFTTGPPAEPRLCFLLSVWPWANLLTSLSLSLPIYKMELPPTFQSSGEDQKRLVCVKHCTQLVVITITYYYCFQHGLKSVISPSLQYRAQLCTEPTKERNIQQISLTGTLLGGKSCHSWNICSAHFFPGSWGEHLPFPSVLFSLFVL